MIKNKRDIYQSYFFNNLMSEEFNKLLGELVDKLNDRCSSKHHPSFYPWTLDTILPESRRGYCYIKNHRDVDWEKILCKRCEKNLLKCNIMILNFRYQELHNECQKLHDENQETRIKYQEIRNELDHLLKQVLISNPNFKQ